MSKYVHAGLTLGVLLGSAAFLAPVTGFAQGTPTPAGTTPQSTAGSSTTEEHDKMRADKKAFLDAKIAALHAGLELTPAQASLWDPVESAIRGLATRREPAHEGHDESATPLDRLKQRSERLAGLANALKTLTDATGPLVASLDATQKEHLPKLLEATFGGRKVLFAAFNVAGSTHGGGQEDDTHAEGGEGDHMGDRTGHRMCERMGEHMGEHMGNYMENHDHDGDDQSEDGRRGHCGEDENGGEGQYWHHRHHHHHPDWDQDGDR